MCQDHDLSPTDLAYKWEAYIDKACDDTSIILEVDAMYEKPRSGKTKLTCIW